MKKQIISCFTVLFATIFGMSLMKIEVFTVASGQIVPSKPKVSISISDGGTLRTLFLRDGDKVSEKQKIAKIDDNGILTSIKNIKAEIRETSKSLGILHNIIANNDLFPPMRPSLFYDLKQKHENYIGDLNRLITYYEKEKSIINSLVKTSSIANIKLIEVNQRLLRDKKEINRISKDFLEKIVFEAENKKSKMLGLENMLESEENKLSKTEIISPISGTISKIHFNEGEYVNTNTVLAEIIPEHEKFKVELFVKPKDIGGIKIGQKVKIKVETFSYNVFGTSDARIAYISPRAHIQTQNGNFFLIKCDLDRDFISKGDQIFYLKNGMNVTASIVRGEVSAFSYFVGPLVKSFHQIGVM